MFGDDFKRRLAFFLTVLSIMLMVLVSCGKRATLSGSAYDIAHRIYDLADEGGRKIYDEGINSDEAYEFGLSSEDFIENIDEARIFRVSEISGGRSMAVIVAKSEIAAGKLFERMYDGYDWVPCDPSDRAAFMLFGRYIVVAKDDAPETEKLCRAFSTLSDGGATVRISENPM